MPAGIEELVTVAVSINDQRLFSFVYGALQALLLLLCYEQFMHDSKRGATEKLLKTSAFCRLHDDHLTPARISMRPVTL